MRICTKDRDLNETTPTVATWHDVNRDPNFCKKYQMGSETEPIITDKQGKNMQTSGAPAKFAELKDISSLQNDFEQEFQRISLLMRLSKYSHVEALKTTKYLLDSCDLRVVRFGLRVHNLTSFAGIFG